MIHTVTSVLIVLAVMVLAFAALFLSAALAALAFLLMQTLAKLLVVNASYFAEIVRNLPDAKRVKLPPEDDYRGV